VQKQPTRYEPKTATVVLDSSRQILAISGSKQSILANPGFLVSAQLRTELTKPGYSPMIPNGRLAANHDVQQFTLDQGLGIATQMSDTGKQRISRAQRSNSRSDSRLTRVLDQSLQLEEGVPIEMTTRGDLSEIVNAINAQDVTPVKKQIQSQQVSDAKKSKKPVQRLMTESKLQKPIMSTPISKRPASTIKKKKPKDSGKFEIDEKLQGLKVVAVNRRRGSGSLKVVHTETAKREDIDQAGTMLSDLAASFDFSIFTQVSYL
jgi:hypothetical protein